MWDRTLRWTVAALAFTARIEAARIEYALDRAATLGTVAAVIATTIAYQVAIRRSRRVPPLAR
jgi:hypothetical protein